MIQVVLKKGQEHSTVMPVNANVDAGTKSDTTRPGSYDKGLIALCHCHHWHHHHHWNHLPVKPGQEVNFIHNFRRSVFVPNLSASPWSKENSEKSGWNGFLDQNTIPPSMYSAAQWPVHLHMLVLVDFRSMLLSNPFQAGFSHGFQYFIFIVRRDTLTSKPH